MIVCTHRTLFLLRRLPLAAVVACALFNCTRQGEFKVIPKQAAPGDVVLLIGANYRIPDSLHVTIGGKQSIIIRIVDQAIEVMVPGVDPGQVKVILRERNRQLGADALTILPSPLRRIFFSIEEGQITLDRVRPYNGHYERVARRGLRLSYDVLNEKGRILYTGAIGYPEPGEVEVFHDPEAHSIKRAQLPGPASFAVKIPYFQGTTTVKLYKAEDGLDLATADGRAARLFLAEFTITP